MFRRAPLFVGAVAIVAMTAYVTLHRSSPGNLSHPHAAVAGSSLLTDCKKCHTSQGLTPGCLKCHTEIQQQLSRRTGYHYHLLNKKTVECARCHSEHNGTDFDLINKISWEGKDFRTFQHSHVTYRLKDAHLKLKCEQCHAAKGRSSFTLPKFPKSPRQITFLGLSQTCISCHADPHAGGRASNCAACHDQKHWRPAPLFNHDNFFPLRGAHPQLKCSQCHSTPRQGMPAADPLRRFFGPTKGKRCLDCHQNPHRARWVETCETCHKVSDLKWDTAHKRMTKAQHALTGFRLVPPHQNTSCQQCHKPGLSFSQKYPDPKTPVYHRFEKTCEGCHKDEHRGQFFPKYDRCAACHTITGWKPNNFGVKMHNATSYPLMGEHLKAACNACHTKDPVTKVRRYVGTPRQCSVCHKDIHAGQFRQSDGKTLCESCHRSPMRWSLLVFNHNTQSQFKLDDAHKNLGCKACHFLVSLPNGTRLVQYKPIGHRCEDCHDFDRR